MSTIAITLDTVIAMSDASGIPVEDLIRAIDARTDADMRSRKAQPKATPTMPAKATPKRNWETAPATMGQQNRIARAEEAILESGRKRGIALIKRATMREAALATGLDARAYYRTLADFTRKHNIKF